MTADTTTLANDQSIDTTDEDLLRLYIGPNAEKFLKVYRNQIVNKKPSWSFNWVVLLAGLPWFFYRKLYLIGLTVLLVPLVLVVIFPSLSGVSMTGMAAAMAILANQLYVQTALHRIKKIKALNLSPDDRDERLRKAGGTSPAGAAFGALIIISILALALIGTAAAKLPGCSDAQVHGMAKSVMTNSLTQQGLPTKDLMLLSFKDINAKPSETRNLCSFSATQGNETWTMFLAVTWNNREAGEYQVGVASTVEDLPN